MNTTTKARNRILSLGLALCLLLGMTLYLPGPVAVRAELPDADDEGKPWDGIDFAALEGNGIYYGTYKHRLSDTSTESTPTPILWRVMGEEEYSQGSGNLTLWSEYVLDNHAFHNSSNEYNNSSIQQYLVGSFLNDFSGAEKDTDLMVPVNVFTQEYTYGSESPTANQSTANDQQVYLPWGIAINPTNTGLSYWTNDVYVDAANNLNGNMRIDSGYDSGTWRGNLAYWKDDAAKSSPVMYWLRSPYSDVSNGALAVYPDGYVLFADVHSPLVVRPAFQLNPSSVIFTSEISDSADITKGETLSNANYSHTAAAGGGAKNYKLVIVNTDVKLDSLSDTDGNLDGDGSETLTIAPGGTLDLTGTISGGAENLVYKIVDRGTGEIVGYGAGNNTTDLTVRGVANVTGAGDLSTTGNYTLYVWAQDNNDDHSHEGSQPMWFPLEVADALSSDATLKYVAGEAISDNGEQGTIANPKTAAISLGQSSWASIADTDLDPTDSNATAELYTDDTYTTAQSPINLDPDTPTALYIKVTAADGVTELYYKVTVTLTTDPTTPTTPATLSIGIMTDDIVEVGQSYRKSIPVEYQNGTATSLTYTVTGQPGGLNAVSLGMSGEISGTPDPGTDTGSPYTVHVTVSDGKGASDTASYELTVNPAGSSQEELILAPIAALEVTEGESFVKTLSVTYTGSGTLAYSATSLPPGITINPSTGVISGAADDGTAADSPYTVTVDVTDNSGNDDSGIFELTVLEGGGTDPDPNNPDPNNPDPDNPDPDNPDRSSSRDRSSGGSNTPDSRVAKTQLPASAFSWDGERTLIIDYERITPLGLLSVQWDGRGLTRGTEYTVYEGSVIVRFDADFITAQAPGDHTVRMEFLNHIGETTVTVGQTAATEEPADHPDNNTHNPNTGGYPDGSYPGATDNPNTGDSGGIWPALLLGSLGAAALVLFKGERKPH